LRCGLAQRFAAVDAPVVELDGRRRWLQRLGPVAALLA